PTYPHATSSPSQPLQLPAATERNRSGRPKRRRRGASSARASSTSPVVEQRPCRVELAIRKSGVKLTAPLGHIVASLGLKRQAPTSTIAGRTGWMKPDGTERAQSRQPSPQREASNAGRPRKRSGNSGASFGNPDVRVP